MLHEDFEILFFINEIVECQSLFLDDYIFNHCTVKEFTSISAKKKFYYDRAISLGIKEEEKLIVEAEKDGEWSQADSETLSALCDDKKKYEKIRDKTEDYLTRQQFISRINSLNDEISTLKKKYDEIIEYSAEYYCNQKIAVEMIQNFVYRKDQKKMDNEEIHSIIVPFFGKFNNLMNYELLAKASFHQSFFEIYVIHSYSPEKIFNRSGFNLTIFQKNLISLSRYILSALKNYPEMPEEIKNDALAILKYNPDKKDKKFNLDDVKSQMSRGISAKEAIIANSKK